MSYRVALFIPTSSSYDRGVLRAIAEYVQRRQKWEIYLPDLERADPLTRPLSGGRWDGIIVRAESLRAAHAVSSCGCPAVDLSAAGFLQNTPVVLSDARAEASLAFEHLQERGYRHLGFCGASEDPGIEDQWERFKELADQAGIVASCHIEPSQLTHARGWMGDQRSLSAWLKSLPRPVGIFACHDARGQQVLEACASAGLGVPEEVAVIGVDNDTVRCSLSAPPLTSIVPDTSRIGYLAAELLTQLMAGTPVSSQIRLVPPTGVVARASTHALGVSDAELSRAVQFIRENFTRPISISDVMAQVNLSRRTLETRFMRLLGRSPRSEIQRCRLEKAKQLLTDTDLPIKCVAAEAGVGTPEYLSVLFKRELGTTPTDYRVLSRSNPGNVRTLVRSEIAFYGPSPDAAGLLRIRAS